MTGNKKPIKERITFARFPSDAGAGRPALYSQMFIEDIHSGILGYDLREQGEKRRIRVEGDGPAAAAATSLCASLARGYVHGGNVVESAVEAVALHLAWFGEALYEICNAGNKQASLESLLPFHIFRLPGAFVQWVPAQDRVWAKGRRYTVLPDRLAWVVQLPKGMGAPRSHKRLLARLTAVSASAPEFWNRDMSEGIFTPEFPFGDYNRMRTAYIARLTRSWGWNRRDSSHTYNTEFFFFYRGLQFRRSQARLRNHIVEEINRLLTRLGVKARLQPEGYPSPTEIGELMDRVRLGELNYVEAFRLSA
jgi:hypothetical protein